MRVDALRLEAGRRGETPQDEERAGACETAALRVQEELGSVALVQIRAATCEIATERVGRLAPDRNDSLLRPLADAAHESFLEVDGRALEPDGLAYPQSSPVEKLDKCAIAQQPRRGSGRRLDQPFGLTGRERPRKRAAPAGQLELRRRVVGARSEQHLMAVERAERGDPARNRRRREPVGAKLRDVGGELGGRRASGRGPEPAREGREVAAI